MKRILLMIMLATSATLFAQKPIEMPLWPNGAPNSNGLKGAEQENEKNRISNVTSPTITVYPAKNGDGKAVIMCPGGGYALLAVDHEGHDMASWFNAQGITYVVLKYRMPNGHREVPLSDASQAITLVRQHAAEWGINVHKVGIMGASAGGHLASTLATHFTAETRPDFQVLLYPVITMDKAYTHNGSRENLIGKNPGKDVETFYSNELQVTAATPKAFIALSGDDKSVPPQNGINYYLALLKNNVSASMHIYPKGGHGWGFLDSFAYKHQWTEELKKWLSEL